MIPFLGSERNANEEEERTAQVIKRQYKSLGPIRQVLFVKLVIMNWFGLLKFIPALLRRRSSFGL